MKIIGSNVAKMSTQAAADMQTKFATHVPGVVLRDARPLFCVYYRIDESSTVSSGFGDVNSMTGDNSPVRYKFVKNLALFGRGKIEVDTERSEEVGLDANINTFTVELPAGVFDPKEGEMFSYYHEDHAILYRITKISEDTVHNNPTYIMECDIKYLSKDVETAVVDDYIIYMPLKDQVIGTYTAVYENIGTDASVIIADDDIDYIKEAQAKIISASEIYLELFMNHEVNNLLADIDDKLIYSNFLNRFINDCDAVVNNENELFLSLDLPKGPAFDKQYKRSFFSDIINKVKIGNYTITDESYSVMDGIMLYYSPYMVIDREIRNMTNIVTKVESDETQVDLGAYKDIVYKYYNSTEIANSDLVILDGDDIIEDMHTFIMLPIVIAIFRQDIKNKMKNNYIYHNNDKLSRRF